MKKFQYRVQILSGIDNATEPVWEGEAFVSLEDPEDAIEIGTAIMTYLQDFVTEWDDRIQPTFKIISRSEVEQADYRLILDVKYDVNGTDPECFDRLLHNIAKFAAGDGLMSGGTEAEVDTWHADVFRRDLEEFPPAARRPIDIEVSERLHDWWFDSHGQRRPSYYSRIKDAVAWYSGRSVEDAVNSLIRSHPELFGITLSDPSAPPPASYADVPEYVNYCNEQEKWGIRVLYLGQLSR